MKIIQEGDKAKLVKARRFTCRACGCVFEANETEYTVGNDYRNGALYSCQCPTCGRWAYAYDR